jgi:hypothetical protein
MTKDLTKFPYLWFCAHPQVFVYHVKHNRKALVAALNYSILYPWIAKRKDTGLLGTKSEAYRILDETRDYSIRQTRLVEFLSFFGRRDLIELILTRLDKNLVLDCLNLFKVYPRAF